MTATCYTGRSSCSSTSHFPKKHSQLPIIRSTRNIRMILQVMFRALGQRVAGTAANVQYEPQSRRISRKDAASTTELLIPFLTAKCNTPSTAANSNGPTGISKADAIYNMALDEVECEHMCHVPSAVRLKLRHYRTHPPQRIRAA